MLRYDKKIKIIKPLSKRAQVSEFRQLDFSEEKNSTMPADTDRCFNLIPHKGRLVQSPCIGKAKMYIDNYNTLSVPSFVGSLRQVFWFSKPNPDGYEGYDEYLIAISESSAVYSIRLDRLLSNQWIYRYPSARGKVTGSCYRYHGNDVFLLASEKDGLMMFDGEELTLFNNAPKVDTMCVHSERVFVTKPEDKFTVWFSDDFDPGNWNVSLAEGGYISLQKNEGEILKMCSFLNQLYVIRESGIYKISAYSDQTQFSVTKLYVPAGNIFAGSVVEAEDKILFMTASGLFSFDGYSVTERYKNLSGIAKNISPQNISACYVEGVYHISARYRFDDGLDDAFRLSEAGGDYINNIILSTELNSGKSCITRGICAVNLTAVNGKICKGAYFCDPGYPYYPLQIGSGIKATSQPLRYWESPSLNLQRPNGFKILRRLEFCATGDFVLYVEADGRVSRFNVESGKNSILPNVDLKAKNFRFRLETSDRDFGLSDFLCEFDLPEA